MSPGFPAPQIFSSLSVLTAPFAHSICEVSSTPPSSTRPRPQRTSLRLRLRRLRRHARRHLHCFESRSTPRTRTTCPPSIWTGRTSRSWTCGVRGSPLWSSGRIARRSTRSAGARPTRSSSEQSVRVPHSLRPRRHLTLILIPIPILVLIRVRVRPRSARSRRLPAAPVGPRGAHAAALGGVAAERVDGAELAAAGREEAGRDGAGDGVHGRERDREHGVVAADRGHADEHGPLDRPRGVDRGRDGQVDQGAQGLKGAGIGDVGGSLGPWRAGWRTCVVSLSLRTSGRVEGKGGAAVVHVNVQGSARACMSCAGVVACTGTCRGIIGRCGSRLGRT